MTNRIKELRKHLGLTQQEFADRIGITRGAVANYDIGRVVPSDAVLSLICREFRVNMDWLKTGIGPVMIEMDRSQKIADFIFSVTEDTPDSARSALIDLIIDLDVEDWEAINAIWRKHRGK